MALTRSSLLRTARMLRTRGLVAAADLLQRTAREIPPDEAPTDPDGIGLDDTARHDMEEPAQYDAEVEAYLKWLGKELVPTFHKLLYQIRDHVKDGNSYTVKPNLVLRGITESLKAYGFQALEGKHLPFHIYEKRTLPKKMPQLPRNP